MIASALRAEIQHFCEAAPDGLTDADFARCAIAAHRLTRGRAVAVAEDGLPSIHALAILVERSAKEAPAAFLACQALCESFMAHLGLDDGAFDRAEAALDAIDDLVEDPAALPELREHLRRFVEHFEQLCKEANRAARRPSEQHVSAA